MLIGRVAETFAIENRGLVIALDVTYDNLPEGFLLKTGDEVVFQTTSGRKVQSHVAGIEISSPWSPKKPFCFLVASEMKSQITAGDEVWTAS